MFANARMYVQCMRECMRIIIKYNGRFYIIDRYASDLLIQTKIKKIK